MSDWDVSMTKALAAVCWVVGLGLSTLAMFVTVRLGALGVFLGIAAGTLTARSWFVGLHCRELSAFNLGQESSTVRPVR